MSLFTTLETFSHGTKNRDRLAARMEEAGEVACCSKTRHLKLILFGHQHRLPPVLRNGCDNFPSLQHATAKLCQKDVIYDRIAGAPGANAVLEALDKRVENAALGYVSVLLDAAGVPPAADAISCQHNLLSRVQNYPDVRIQILNALERSSRTLSLYHPDQNNRFNDQTRLAKASSNYIVAANSTLAHRNWIYFPKLPLELRLMIWRFSITGRVVQMYHCRQRIKSTCPTPALLRVNKESRDVALKEYKKFGSDTAFGEVMFSYDIDTLYFSHRSFAFQSSSFLLREMRTRWPEILAGLKYIAVRMACVPQKNCHEFIKRLSEFEALEEFTLVFHDDVLDFGQHETELLDYEAQWYPKKLGRTERTLEHLSELFASLDVNASTRPFGMTVFKCKYAESYRVT